MNRRIALPLLATALLLGGCIEDETIVVPQETQANRVFRRIAGESPTAYRDKLPKN